MQDKNLKRRDFLRLSGLATAGVIATACGQAAPASDPEPTTAPASGGSDPAPTNTPVPEPAETGGLREIPRERTLILQNGGVEGQYTNVGLGNMYAQGSTGHRAVTGAMEPLFYYSAFADETIPWLATGAEYNDDYTELTVFIREGAEWNDGTPFTANDVVFTINMLKEFQPLLRDSAFINNAVAEATVVDDLTARITFNAPRPRILFTHLTAKFDTGMYWVPEHVFGDLGSADEVLGFGFYDPEQGWPLYTGPYNVVDWRAEQQVIDRNDDWWAAKIGFAELPEIERILMIPWTGEERGAQLIINNETDSCLDLRATTITQVVNQNPAIITHTNRELPLGYIDWWPTSYWFNCEDGPFADANVRWAVSLYTDREQMLDVALEGSGILTPLPFPQYPPLQPYFDAAADLLEEYNTLEYNPDKAAERMIAAGYEQDGDGFWVQNGERVPAVIHGFGIFNDIGPVLAEQLRRGGFEAEYVTPADSGTRMVDGTAKIMLFGHGGSITDPYHTLDFYHSKYYRPTGEPAEQRSRYNNPEYDAIMDEMATIPPDPNNPAYMDIYLQALEIYLRDLIDAPIQQWLHRMPMNTTYFDNWPTEDNNYVNGAFWHQTVGILLRNLTVKA